MSLTIRHLNADSTFLLTFLPAKTHVNSTDPIPGAFSILLDPWLSGAAAYLHPDFSIVQHTVPACINSLADIPEPDLVVISCAKPDHCHEDTLRQLPSHGTKTRILANATTAKTIRSWNHFDPKKVQIFEKFDRQQPKRETIQRFHIPPISAFGSPGEVTVAYLPGKFDVAKLHAAIGVTYRPPTGLPTYFAQVARPLSPPGSPNSAASGWSTSYSSPGDRTMSVIFSPHGLAWSQIQPYASSHLVAESALPLTALLHPFDRVQNPWWLGGNVSAGLPGGLEIARNLLARYWISAHDEEKDVGGITALPLRTEKFFRWQIERLIEHEMGRMGTEVVEIDVGHALVMDAL